ncbi:hypothetical protein AXG93_136s1070 [Marchantia polymorpha subsp. ruderalis]|uniref:Uncharacterized protein n=1 Tax=Marchantia polymorpha subsp. ruderalis TaxID=1480154 RepID=A0A176W6K0_MARPO|nr:hypothetical protein AXG93_136s1070 [Marchantia polymorpha subsp. ruderalis]
MTSELLVELEAARAATGVTTAVDATTEAIFAAELDRLRGRMRCGRESAGMGPVYKAHPTVKVPRVKAANSG